jgi:RNA polymerase sigma-70 factor (ECF subfamily)
VQGASGGGDRQSIEVGHRNPLFPGGKTVAVALSTNISTQTIAEEAVSSQAVEYTLVQRCKAGDKLAFDQLISAHQDRVLNTAFRLMGNYDEALDLTQEVFLNCFRKIGNFKGDSALSTWLYRITVNTAKNRWKYQQSRGMNKTHSLDAPMAPDDEERIKQFPDSQPTPRKIASDRETFEYLEEQLALLNEEHREVLVLRYMEELSYEEIADILRLSLGTVKSRIHRARNELKDLMDAFL